jgi:FAD/FMN-containing dehydrogenase/Fe-S oxidoreductase
MPGRPSAAGLISMSTYMIPQISQTSEVQYLYLKFLQALEKRGFSGDIKLDYANRTVLATDNSIYQVLPQGAVFPRNLDDLVALAHLSQEKEFRGVVLSPRGGGTGTNGQSLTDGLVVDVSKHMNRILEINHRERWVRVEAGVVKDQLNAALKPFGLFFAPELSTSNRATIGGMVNTDASGQGSCVYGKTRDHVLELTTVLLEGSVLRSRALNDDEFEAISEQQDRVGLAHRLIDNIGKEHKALIAKKFPKLNRCLTGYDLAHIRDAKGRFNLNNILCGSEGTLGFVTEIKLNLVPIPKFAALMVVQYADFNSALRDAKRLMQAQPTSIETVDSKVLNLAKGDNVWHEVAEFFPSDSSRIQGINLVEYTANDEAELRAGIERLTAALGGANANPACLGHSVAWGAGAVNRLWGMRKKAVGLLGNTQGEARPIPFIEDTAVPPEHLADYIEELRTLLDDYGLSYGMFGHVDAGVLHLRPAIDMKDPEQEKLVRVISDQVAELTYKYHGLLWGEHGKGVRSEYAPKFFGELYPQLQRIKAAFDPHNQLNPGKIATPSAQIELLKIDGVPTRGQTDRYIETRAWNGFSEAVHCNGNGLCYNWSFQDAMCPSWKATRERVHSPKGRATLVREWLKQLSDRGFDPMATLAQPLGFFQELRQLPEKIKNTRSKKRGEYDFSHEVYDAMAGCLACKSCTGQCPIKVDVPSFRSKFLALYYTRYMRPLKDYLVGALEFVLPVAALAPGVYNALSQNKLSRWALSRGLGFEDPPRLSNRPLRRLLKENGIPLATEAGLKKLGALEKSISVILVQDAFTTYFEAPLVLEIAVLLRKLGFKPLVAPYRANGKPLHVHGFLHRFGKVADKQAQLLRRLSEEQIALVGIDPAMTLTFRSEYVQALGKGVTPKVQLLQEWLLEKSDHLAQRKSLFQDGGVFKLMPHCTEKTNAPTTIPAWQKVFAILGQTLEVVPTGCCGMSGTYGHESANRATSAHIFAQSWRGPVMAQDNQGQLTVTGFSCRSQVKREAFVKLPHPLQILAQQLR